jgi:hypothetical protein
MKYFTIIFCVMLFGCDFDNKVNKLIVLSCSEGCRNYHNTIKNPSEDNLTKCFKHCNALPYEVRNYKSQ